MSQGLEIVYRGYTILDMSEENWVKRPRILIFKDPDNELSPILRCNTLEEATLAIDKILHGEDFSGKIEEWIE